MSDGIINLEEERQGLLAQIRTLTKERDEWQKACLVAREREVIILKDLRSVEAERDKCVSTIERLRHTIAEHAGDSYRIHFLEEGVRCAVVSLEHLLEVQEFIDQTKVAEDTLATLKPLIKEDEK